MAGVMLACIAPERIASSKRAFTIASYSGVTTNGWSSPSPCCGAGTGAGAGAWAGAGWTAAESEDADVEADVDELRLLGGEALLYPA